MRSSESMRCCLSCLCRRASPPATASITNPNPCARTSRGVMPSLSLVVSSVVSPRPPASTGQYGTRLIPRLAGRSLGRWTPWSGWSLQRQSSGVVRSPRHLPWVYYTPSAAAPLVEVDVQAGATLLHKDEVGRLHDPEPGRHASPRAGQHAWPGSQGARALAVERWHARKHLTDGGSLHRISR